LGLSFRPRGETYGTDATFTAARFPDFVIDVAALFAEIDD
jgi:hypothetical protein